MDPLQRFGMKGPVRPAPAVPGFAPMRYSPVTNWNDDPFFAEVFEPSLAIHGKKKPPPRPPPPKLKPQPEIPNKPSHFIRKPTILTSLMSRKDRTSKQTAATAVHQKFATEFQNENMQRIFTKCERKNIPTASLIDLSSPPSSPTFTTRSSSDGLSVDSFCSDVTSSTNQHRVANGNQSQTESGFEDDFDLFLSNRKPMAKEDTLDDFENFDPFSPAKPEIQRKPSSNKLNDQLLCNGKSVQSAVQTHRVPTIIRAKPARPKPPENSSLLKIQMKPSQSIPMKLNMSVPIKKVNTGIDYHSTAPSLDTEWSSERESSPPMPSIPPPPPPVIDETDLADPLVDWPVDDEPNHPEENFQSNRQTDHAFFRQCSVDIDEPYAIALYDYCGDHSEDLSFEVNAKVKLIRRLDKEWLYGRLSSGAEGIFPANYVEIRVPLPGETIEPPLSIGTAIAQYEFQPTHPGDLRLAVGDKVSVTNKINDEWYFGESNGNKGQFPANYVQMQ